MEIVSLLIFIMVIPLLIFIGSLFLVDYLLKKSLKPNKEYLEEVSNFKICKILKVLNIIILIILTIASDFGINNNLLISFVIILEVIRNTYILHCLKTKNESKNTRKYILLNFCFQVFVVIMLFIIILYYIK